MRAVVCRAGVVRRGFTLLELLVVLLVIGVLAAVAVVAYGQVTDRAHTARAQADLRNVTQAALVEATTGGLTVLDRSLFTTVLEDALGGAVTDGIEAAAYRLGYAVQAPRQPGDYSVGFGDGVTPWGDGAGTHAVVTTADPSGQVYAAVVTTTGGVSAFTSYAAGTAPVDVPTGVPGEDPGTEGEPGEPTPAQVKLLAEDPAASKYFGYSVAVDGDTAVIGAPYDNSHGDYSGAAYIFTRTGTTWTQQAKLTADDPAAGDYFGRTVAVDGNTALLGAHGDDGAGTDAGAVYVLVRTGTTWTQQAKLTAADAAASDWFGFSVAVGGDTAVIGAYGADGGGSNAGAAYVFTRTGTTWTQQAKLTADDPAAGDYFGRTVAVDGDTTVVGAHQDDDGGEDAGAAYVFTRTGTTWTLQAKLTADDPAAGDWFGYSVAVDGDTAVIGTYYDDEGGSDAGAAYVFTRTGTTWTQQAKLTAADAAASDWFGFSVAVDGDTALIGAYGDDDGGSNAGAAYVVNLHR